MDPLSLTFGIAGLLPLVAKAITSAKDYAHGVRTAKEAIAALITELEALQFSLTNLQRFLQSFGDAPDNLRFEHSSVLVTCTAACKTKLVSLCQKLGDTASLRGRLLWPFSEKEHQKAVQELRNFTTWMHFALTIDGCRLLSQTSDDVLRVLAQQLDHFKATQSVAETVTQISSSLKEQTLLLETSREQQKRKQILDWISTTKYYQKHQALRASRAQNAGDWILRSPEFVKWRDSAEEKDAVLWCQGIQGSGKTNVMSLVVDSLQETTQQPPRAVAYFFFDHQDQSAQSPSTVLSCILRQLVDKLPSIPQAVSKVYETTGQQGTLSEFEREQLMAEVAKELERVYVVIDALDECAAEHRATLVRALRQLMAIPGLRLLLASRPHVREMTVAFPTRLDLEIAAREEDITSYLRHELSRNGFYDVADEEFADDLIQKLTKGADGMFLLPVLQLRTILKEPTLGEMEDSLNNISHNLTEAFEETVSRIQNLPTSRSRMGMDILMYVSHATRTLSVDELRDLLAVDPKRKHVNAKYRPTEKVVLECCQGLVTVDAQTGDVRTCHYSVTEYIHQNAGRLFPRAQAILTTRCLHYLMLEDFSSGPWAKKVDIVSHIKGFPFLSYAARFWGRHAKHSEADGDVQAALAQYFALRQAMATANQVRQYDMGYVARYWAVEESLSFTALHYAGRYGLTQTVTALLDTGAYDVNELTQDGATPIIQAAAGGHVETVGLLMQRGADPYLSNWYGNALHCAIEAGHARAVRELVSRWGMGVQEKGEEGSTMRYLLCAMDRDSVDAFETLVELGVGFRPDAGETSSAKTLFKLSCARGCPKIVDLMTRRGWLDIGWRYRKGQTALHLAARTGNLAVIRRLLDAGADIYSVDDHDVSALELIQQTFRSRALAIASNPALREKLGQHWDEGSLVQDTKPTGADTRTEGPRI